MSIPTPQLNYLHQSPLCTSLVNVKVVKGPIETLVGQESNLNKRDDLCFVEVAVLKRLFRSNQRCNIHQPN